MTANYRFGRFKLTPATRQLLVDDEPALVGARAFDLLLALIERRDRLVTKTELLDLVWPGLVVEENNLMVQVSALRKILGQDAIATIPGRGYRFTAALAEIDDDDAHTTVGPVRTAEATQIRPRFGLATRAATRRRLAVGVLAIGLAGGGAWLLTQMQQAAAVAQSPAFSVAVMPFAAPGGSPQDDAYAKSLSEGVLATLGRFRFFKMTSTRRILGYEGSKTDTHGVGRDLNVRYLIDGQVRQMGSKMEISAQLIKADSGTNLWNERLPVDIPPSAEATSATIRKLSTRLAAAVHEDELRRAMAHPIAGSTVDLALQFEAATRKAQSPHERLAERRFLDEALRIDPDFLPARQYLSTLLDDMAGDWSIDSVTRARLLEEEDTVTLRSVQIAETSPGAWYERAQALIRLGRWDQALAANAKANSMVEDRPDVAFLAQRVWILQAMDRPDEALVIAERANSIPPDVDTGQEGFAIRMVCSTQLLLGHYKEAVASCEKSAARDNWWVDHMWLTAGYAQMGDSARADSEAGILHKLKPDLTIEKLEATHVGNPANLERTRDQIFAGLRKAGVPDR